MRTRHQDGWVEERGRRTKRWYGHYYVYEQDASGQETRRHIGVQLGEKAQMRKWEAENKLRDIIAAATKGRPIGNELTLEWFTRERFLPMREPQWAPSTHQTNLGNIDHHILPALGSMALAEIDKFQCQVFLNNLAQRNFSFTVVDHCRTMLKAILEEAVDQEFIGKNPARKVVNPETKESEKHVLAKEDAKRLMDALSFRDRLIVMVAAFCAMRPGEIFGLRWSSFRGDHFQIEGTAWRGALRPGKAKTKKSKAPVTIPDAIMPILNRWREQNATATAEDLIFPTERRKVKGKLIGGTPIRPENWLRRRITPIAETLQIAGPVNFQVLRRTFATNAQAHGNAKDVQVHLRHTDISTTLNEYTQAIPESVRKLVNDVANDVLTAKPKATLTVVSRRIQ